ncbi:MAG: hypothetical protein AB7D07_11715 [Desulfovibrionaceae bacterium]
MRVLAPGEAEKSYSLLQSNLENVIDHSVGAVKASAVNVYLGIRFGIAGAGSVDNFQIPQSAPPEVRTGLVMRSVG